MASSSNSEFNDIYDIFLSFRGLDTRKKFTDHLYEALKRAGFQTFRDDDEIERGENIKSELRKAITNSRMSVIVLSENYAKSTACLFEIQTILEHREKSDHLILPVFYEMDPGKIKEQAKNLNFVQKKVRVEEMNGWSAALKDVAGIAGMVSENQSNGYEAKFIGEIVAVIKSKLAGKHLRGADRVSQTNDANGKKCYMIGARGLTIAHANVQAHWNWASHSNSRGPEVAELLSVWWLGFRTKMKLETLSPSTRYAIYLVFKIARDSRGLTGPATAAIRTWLSGVKTKGPRCTVFLVNGEHVTAEYYSPQERSDGWTEVQLGEFFVNLEDYRELLLKFKFVEDKDIEKKGLIIQGIEFRPRNM